MTKKNNGKNSYENVLHWQYIMISMKDSLHLRSILQTCCITSVWSFFSFLYCNGTHTKPYFESCRLVCSCVESAKGPRFTKSEIHHLLYFQISFWLGNKAAWEDVNIIDFIVPYEVKIDTGAVLEHCMFPQGVMNYSMHCIL